MHVQAKSLRNICFKVSKFGSNTAQYEILRRNFIEMSGDIGRFTPTFIIDCETPQSLRAFLSELNLDDEEGTVYKRRRRFLEKQFAELIYWSERDALSHAEIDAFRLVNCADRATMNHVLSLMRDCVETDPRRSLLLSRHAVVFAASYLLESNGVYPNIKGTIQDVIEQIIHMAEHATADQDIHFSPEKPFVTCIMPLVNHIDRQNSYYGWEEGNRKADYPTVQIARNLFHAAAFICEVLWQWTLDDSHRANLQIDNLGEDDSPGCSDVHLVPSE